MKKFYFTKHALERLFERNISLEDCEEVYKKNIIIESYPDNTPFPSELRMGDVGGRILHIVVAHDGDNVFIVTAYEPEKELWEEDFKNRKKGK